MSNTANIPHPNPNRLKPAARPPVLYGFPVQPSPSATDPDFIRRVLNAPETDLYFGEPRAVCVGRRRKFNYINVPDVEVPRQFCVSSNPVHQRAAWAAFLDANAPLAQYIATFRGTRREPLPKLDKIASLVGVRLNQRVLGRSWDHVDRSHEHIAVVGVVEGTYAVPNIHMHLCFYSRSQLLDTDMEDLKDFVKRKRIGNEFWPQAAVPEKVTAYHNYILKEFSGPSGANSASRVLVSKSFTYVR